MCLWLRCDLYTMWDVCAALLGRLHAVLVHVVDAITVCSPSASEQPLLHTRSGILGGREAAAL